ncbi:MAG: hypothetical protein EOM26_09540 [Alphaproteobacteria bacterium]|nr:hypothetical protein [Alphaproteobacteria bacterium]
MLKERLLAVTMIAGAASLLSTPVAAQEVALYDDDDPIVISGTVAEVDGDEFVLNYGEGRVTVEMDDWDWFLNEAEALIPGERVTVSGWIDDDLFEGREIEAETVYVSDRYTRYFEDPEVGTRSPDTFVYSYTGITPDESWISTSGRIESIDGRAFTLANDAGEIRVETGTLGYNPMDEDGFQKLEAGDRVYVSGLLDNDFFERRTIEANQVVTLSEQTRRRQGSTGEEGREPENDGAGSPG